ncbi:hypothetical protein Hsar01_00955 [Haloferula sargassicola]|uniref:Ice-binding protein C-terminal domain-containing protein n=2 Tax=Haloferula sargassicola TaxID=490096 RepID=A0ABP9UR07_9BACT
MLGLVAAANGQTVTYYDGTGPVPNNSYYRTDSRVVSADPGTTGQYAVTFNDFRGGGTGTEYSIDPAGLYMTTWVHGDGSTSVVYDFCSELFVGINNPPPAYTVTPGFGTLGTSEQSNLSAFLSNAIPLYDAAPDDGTKAIYAAAMQIGIWQVIEGSNISVAGSYPGDATTAVGYASDWLTNVGNGTWVDQGNFNYYYADAPGEQDRLWVEAVPEPSAALLGLLGFGLMARRRR